MEQRGIETEPPVPDAGKDAVEGPKGEVPATPNPAKARAPATRRDTDRDSDKGLAMIRAALALLDVAPVEARRLIETALALLEPSAVGNVVPLRLPRG